MIGIPHLLLHRATHIQRRSATRHPLAADPVNLADLKVTLTDPSHRARIRGETVPVFGGPEAIELDARWCDELIVRLTRARRVLERRRRAAQAGDAPLSHGASTSS